MEERIAELERRVRLLLKFAESIGMFASRQIASHGRLAGEIGAVLEASGGIRE